MSMTVSSWMSFARSAVTEREILLALNLAQDVGAKSAADLMAAFGNPQALLDLSSSSIAERAGISAKRAEAVVRALQASGCDDEIRAAQDAGVRILTRNEPDFPKPLLHIADPPPVLYVKGEYRPTDAIALAIVGARRASHYGTQMAAKLAASLAGIGFTIVSGLARGIDAAAHRGALDAGGRTLAVCGCGLAQIYPREHEELADRIAGAGALLSEFPMAFPVLPQNFPRRNRLISGLCLGVVIVEAAKRSGSLITARHAAEQGREVFAVPGRADSPTAKGAHALIKDGAKLVDTVDDILEEFPDIVARLGRPEEESTPEAAALNQTEAAVLSACDAEPVHPDTIAVQTGLAIPAVLSTLSVLSLRKLVTRTPGGLWAKTL